MMGVRVITALPCGGSPGSLGVARDDGGVSISFLYISNQVLRRAKLPQLLSFIYYLLSYPAPHHFDRSAARAKRRNQGVSRTKHSLDFCRVRALTVYCVCTRIKVLRKCAMRNGLSSLRRFAWIPRQARNDGGYKHFFPIYLNQVLLHAKLPQLLSFIYYLLSEFPPIISTEVSVSERSGEIQALAAPSTAWISAVCGL